MRDLKHLLFFENLLQQANNELVQQACKDGRHAIAYNCSYIPEVLLDVTGCFGVRLRAPGCTNPDLATYYMTNRSCPYSKSILERAFEVSSMGIRVSPESLDRQLTVAGCDDRRSLPFHRALLEGKLPLTIGGGIGQSRVCMLLLGKAHIGEVQASVWDEATMEACCEAGVVLL